MTDLSANPQRITLLDGTKLFKDEESARAEAAVAKVLERYWRCELTRFPELNPIDWYAARDKRMIGLLELKGRTHASDTYETVFLSVAKWFALIHGEMGLRVPGIFAAGFLDQICWIPARAIDASRHRIAGRTDRGVPEFEPIIDVPVAQMTAIPVWEDGNDDQRTRAAIARRGREFRSGGDRDRRARGGERGGATGAPAPQGQERPGPETRGVIWPARLAEGRPGHG